MQNENRESSSMDLLEKLLGVEEKLFERIETVISVLCRAALAISVEAVVEGWISIAERHDSMLRPLGQQAMDTEVIIAVNGPEVVHSESVV